MTSRNHRRDHTGRRPARTHTPGASSPRRFTARTPEDLLAFVPLALGFVPQESIVVIALGRSGPQARVELPQDEVEASTLGLLLSQTCQRHGVERVVVIGYSQAPAQHRDVVLALARVMAEQGLEVVDLLAATPTHWFPLEDLAAEPQPYDQASHPFRVEAVVEGLVVHDSRADVAAGLAPDPDAVHRTERALGPGDEPPERVVPLDCRSLWMKLCRDVERDAPLGAPEARAHLLRCLGEPEFLEAVVFEVEHGQAARHLEHWIRLLRATPAAHVAKVAAVVAFLAWRCGNGALAWCAIDRGVDAPADEVAQPLLDMVQTLLVEAVSPVPGHDARRGDTPKSA